MGIFHHRPLFTCCMIAMTVSVVGFFIVSGVKIVAICLFLLLAVLLALLFFFKRISKYTACILVPALLLSVAALLTQYAGFDAKYEKSRTLYGKECIIRGLVVSERYSSGNLSGYYIRVINADGEECDVKATLDCMFVSDLQPGYLFEAYVGAEDFETNINGYEERQDMLSEGCLISFTLNSDSLYVIADEDCITPEIFFSQLNARLSYKLNSLVGREYGRLCSALLLGNREALGDDITRDFSRAGVSHILALSGMHMSIIMGMFAMLLRRLRTPKLARALILSVLALFYLALTGFSLSATRSVIMLLAVYLSMLFSCKGDTLTSLGEAGLLILVFSPGAVVDIGFWMSFAATFGLVVYMPLVNLLFEKIAAHIKFKVFRKSLSYIVSLVAASFCALIPLIIVIMVFVREISPYTALSSAVLSLPTAGVIFLSLILLLLGNVGAVRDICVPCVRFLCKLMTDHCAYISEKRQALVSLDYGFALPFAIIFAAVLFVCLTVRLKRKGLSLIPVVTLLTAFFVTICVIRANDIEKLDSAYLNCSSVSDMIVMTEGGEAVILDISNGSRSSYSKAVYCASQMRATEIRAVVLTDYTTAHTPTLSRLFKSERVRELWIPQPTDSDGYYKMLPIIERADENNVAVFMYSPNESLTFWSNLTLNVGQDMIDRSAVPVTLLDIRADGDRYLYVSSAFPESDLVERVGELSTQSNCIIIGARGPKPKTKYSINAGESLREIIFANTTCAAYADPESIPDGVGMTVNAEIKELE